MIPGRITGRTGQRVCAVPAFDHSDRADAYEHRSAHNADDAGDEVAVYEPAQAKDQGNHQRQLQQGVARDYQRRSSEAALGHAADGQRQHRARHQRAGQRHNKRCSEYHRQCSFRKCLRHDISITGKREVKQCAGRIGAGDFSPAESLEVENISPLYIKKEVQEKFSCRGYRGVPYTFSKSPKVWGTNRGFGL